MEVFSAILKESLVSVTMATLQELSLLTAVISQCRAGEHGHIISTNTNYNYNILKLQTQHTHTYMYMYMYSTHDNC